MDQATMGAIINWFQTLSPFVILLLTFRYTSIRNRDDALAAARKELDDREKEEMRADVERANQTVRDLAELVNSTHALNEELSASIAHNIALNKLNGQYTHEVAQLVIALTDGIKTNHMNGNIDSAIARYREFERSVMGSIITGETHL